MLIRPASAAVLLALGAATVPLSSDAATPYLYETVDATGFTGVYTSLALDAQGNPRISYYDQTNGDLRYASKSGGVWTLETVDATGSTGYYTSLALDAQGNPRISYYDTTNFDLRYASKSGGAWTLETVDATGSTGQDASLALDAQGNPRISYYDFTNGDLRYASKSGSTWTLETVDATGDAGSNTSLALDAQGNPRISYYDRTNIDLRYASKSGSTWTLETVDVGGTAYYTSLALDAQGNPRIGYFDLGANSDDLRYASKSGGTWTLETVDAAGSTGLYTSLALDAQGNPHISYCDNTSGDLRYADASFRVVSPVGGERWGVGTTQSVTWVGTGPVSIELSVDGGASYATLIPSVSTNTVALTVPGVTTDRARIRITRSAPFSTSDSPGFFSIAPDLVSPWWTSFAFAAGTQGDYPSLALDAHGSARAAYDEGGDLKYASKTGGATWVAETVDATGTTGLYTSLALDAQGVPRISYYDQTNGDLKYAFKSGVSWVTQTVQATGTVGQYTSLALDAAGNPRISYYDVTNGDLRYASYNGVTWTTETADAGILGGNVGQYTSLALDAAGNPRVSYYDVTNGNLRYASKAAGTWTQETVDSPGITGQYTSLALDAQGNPRIAYYDATNGDLRSASKDNGVWTLETVDATGTTGQSASLGLDAQGNPRIAYSASDRVRFASKSAAGWVLETVDASVATTYLTALRLDAYGNARIVYADAIDRDLRYASAAVEVSLPAVGEVWPVGASRALRWDGTGRVDVSLSTDGGSTWQLQRTRLAPGEYRLVVPHTPTKFAKFKVERAVPYSVSETGLFTIQSSIALLAPLTATPSTDGGAQLTWSTDPGPADLAGYRLERRDAASATFTTLVPLTKETTHHDAAAPLGATYRLHAVNGLGEELMLGEASLAPARPLAAWPQPLRGGDITVSFAVASELGGGASDARVDVLDTAGRLVRTLAHATYPPGYHTTTWDAHDVANGVYVLRAASGGRTTSIKVLIAR